MKKSNLKGNGCKWQILPLNGNGIVDQNNIFCRLKTQGNNFYRVDLECRCSFYQKGIISLEEYLNPPHYGIG